MKKRVVNTLLAAFVGGMILSSSGTALGSGFYASADWLNLKPRCSDMDFVIVDSNSDTNPQGSLVAVDYDRSNGARVVLGYKVGSCWDFSMDYQTLHSSNHGQVNQPTGGSLWATRVHPDSVIGSHAATSAAATTSLDYDVIDLMLSRRLHLGGSQQMELTLFGGFRYATIDQSLDIQYVDDVNGRTADISNPSNLDAYGIRLGGQLEWNFRQGWSIFGRGSFSVLGARINSRFRETDNSSIDVVDVTKTYYQAVPVMETALGIAFSRNCWKVGFGYEMALWGNIGERLDFSDDIEDQKFSSPSSDLLLDGFFLRFAYCH